MALSEIEMQRVKKLTEELLYISEESMMNVLVNTLLNSNTKTLMHVVSSTLIMLNGVYSINKNKDKKLIHKEVENNIKNDFEYILQLLGEEASKKLIQDYYNGLVLMHERQNAQSH